MDDAKRVSVDLMNVGADWFALGMWNEAELAKVKHLR